MFAGLREAAPPKKGLTSNERTEVHLIKRHTKAHREYKGKQMAETTFACNRWRGKCGMTYRKLAPRARCLAGKISFSVKIIF